MPPGAGMPIASPSPGQADRPSRFSKEALCRRRPPFGEGAAPAPGKTSSPSSLVGCLFVCFFQGNTGSLIITIRTFTLPLSRREPWMNGPSKSCGVSVNVFQIWVSLRHPG